FEPLGFPTEGRPFRPHLTLGRAGGEARPRDFTGLEAALGALQFAETLVIESLDLMQSTLQSGGAVYHVRHSERLSYRPRAARLLRHRSGGGARGLVVPRAD